jgi:hypothetical protein
MYPIPSISRNYSDDETVDPPPTEKRCLLETRSGNRARTYADEEKSGSSSSFNTMSSGNDLSLSDLAGMKKRSDTSGLLVTTGTVSTSGGRGNITTQEEHQADMQAKRLLWQQEVDFHESSVRRQRAAMIQESERVEEEYASKKSQKNFQNAQQLHISRTLSEAPASPNVTSDLRQKLRDLETEMDEMKARNIFLENEKNDAVRAVKREKEVSAAVDQCCIPKIMLCMFCTTTSVPFFKNSCQLEHQQCVHDSTALHRTALHRTALCCTKLCYIALCCSVLHCIVLSVAIDRFT